MIYKEKFFKEAEEIFLRAKNWLPPNKDYIFYEDSLDWLTYTVIGILDNLFDITTIQHREHEKRIAVQITDGFLGIQKGIENAHELMYKQQWWEVIGFEWIDKDMKDDKWDNMIRRAKDEIK